MWTCGIVVTAPSFDQDLGFSERIEGLPIQELSSDTWFYELRRHLILRMILVGRWHVPEMQRWGSTQGGRSTTGVEPHRWARLDGE